MPEKLVATLTRLGWVRIKGGNWVRLDTPSIRIRPTARLLKFETRRHSIKRRRGVWEVRLTLDKPTNYRGFQAMIKRMTGEVASTRIVPKQWNGIKGNQRYHGPEPTKRIAGGGKVKGLPSRNSCGW